MKIDQGIQILQLKKDQKFLKVSSISKETHSHKVRLSVGCITIVNEHSVSLVL